MLCICFMIDLKNISSTRSITTENGTDLHSLYLRGKKVSLSMTTLMMVRSGTELNPERWRTLINQGSEDETFIAVISADLRDHLSDTNSWLLLMIIFLWSLVWDFVIMWNIIFNIDWCCIFWFWCKAACC